MGNRRLRKTKNTLRRSLEARQKLRVAAKIISKVFVTNAPAFHDEYVAPQRAFAAHERDRSRDRCGAYYRTGCGEVSSFRELPASGSATLRGSVWRFADRDTIPMRRENLQRG